MDVLCTHGAGLDAHPKRGTAWRITPDSTGQQADGIRELKELGTLPLDWLARSDGLTQAGITQVAMERPGASWTPVCNLLEGTVPILLVHAVHVQRRPGRQPDQADACWRAKRMR